MQAVGRCPAAHRAEPVARGAALPTAVVFLDSAVPAPGRGWLAPTSPHAVL